MDLAGTTAIKKNTHVFSDSNIPFVFSFFFTLDVEKRLSVAFH
jgi:hypothetical protein